MFVVLLQLLQMILVGLLLITSVSALAFSQLSILIRGRVDIVLTPKCLKMHHPKRNAIILCVLPPMHANEPSSVSQPLSMSWWETDDNDEEYASEKQVIFDANVDFPWTYRESHGNRNFTSRQTEIEEVPRRSRRRVPGVGRRGYNQTLLELCEYDKSKYHELHEELMWKLHLNLLKEYFADHGHVHVPFRYEVTTVHDYYANGTRSDSTYIAPLGRWLHKLRISYLQIQRKDQHSTQSNILNPKRIHQLNELNINWKFIGSGRRPIIYNQRLDQLRQFRNQHGHTNVPVEIDRTLGLWVRNQRASYRRWREGRKSSMIEERIEKLDDVGFDFGDDVDSVVRKKKTMISMTSSKKWTDSTLLYRRLEREWEDMLYQWKISNHLITTKTTYGEHILKTDSLSKATLALWELEQRTRYASFLHHDATRLPTYGDERRIRLLAECYFFDTSIRYFDTSVFVSKPFDHDECSNYGLPIISMEDKKAILPWEDRGACQYNIKWTMDSLRLCYATYGYVHLTLKSVDSAITNWTKTMIRKKRYRLKKATIGATAIELYSFMRRLQWELRHHYTRHNWKGKQHAGSGWILHDHKDVVDFLRNVGFFHDDNPTSTPLGSIMTLPVDDPRWTILSNEYDWWEHYHDLVRYNHHNGNWNLVKEGLWYTRELDRWCEDQLEAYRCTVNGENENGLTERQYLALRRLGYQFLHQHRSTRSTNEDNFNNPPRTFLPRYRNTGRRPAVLSLDAELNMTNSMLNATSDLSSLSDTVHSIRRQYGWGDESNGLPLNKVEWNNLAWFLQYELLRREFEKVKKNIETEIEDDVEDIEYIEADKRIKRRLQFWIDNQREQYYNYWTGKRSSMTRRRIELLKDIQLDWEGGNGSDNITNRNTEDEFIDMVDMLMQFRETRGHCYVPLVYPRDEALGRWVFGLRQTYLQLQKMEEGPQKPLSTSLLSSLVQMYRLTPERARLLIYLGMDLAMDNMSFSQMTYATLWQCKVEELLEYKRVFGHCKVPIDYASPYYDLALWVKEQRTLYQRHAESIPSYLDEQRICELKRVGLFT